MRKIFFTLFLLGTFFFPQHEAFAQEACVEMVCPDGTQKVSGTQCAASATSNRVTPITPMCEPGKNPSNPSDVSRCVCNPIGPGAPVPAAPAAAPPATTTTQNSCDYCPEDTYEVVGGICLRNVGSLWGPVSRLKGCPIGKHPSPSLDDPNCACINTAIDCRLEPNKCTGGQGLRCGVNAGERNQQGGTGIETAIGCFPSEPKALVEGLLRYITLAGGGIAFLLMLMGALQLITAEGNPESVKHGQERFYSAIIGLLLIIFAVLLMQVIGVDILGIRELQPNTTTTNQGEN